MAHDKPRIGPPSPQILETEVAEEISLYDPLTENVVVLNGPASDIWRLSDGESDLDEIVALLAAAYGVDPDRIRAEVEETIHSFHVQGLLQTEQG
jgi:hypothetical protein